MKRAAKAICMHAVHGCMPPLTLVHLHACSCLRHSINRKLGNPRIRYLLIENLNTSVGAQLPILQEGTERISFRMLNQFVHKYGGSSLSVDELRSIFVDFKPNEDNLITREEFITFFSRVSRTITNKDFDALVVDMMA